MATSIPLNYDILLSSPLPQQPIGENTEHRFEHLQQQMHLSLSTVGAANPTCEIAPTGQTGMVGQAWFWGQSTFRITIMEKPPVFLHYAIMSCYF